MPKPRLAEIVALVSGRKAEVQKNNTEVYHLLQKEALFDGLSRTYKPREEGGEKLPGEQKLPQMHCEKLLGGTLAKTRDFWDLVITLDSGNAAASADIVVGDMTLVSKVPVPTLLFLEKSLADIVTLLSALPTPAPTEQWSYDPQQNMLVSAPSTTVRIKKVKKPLVLYPSTEQHPAQTQLIEEDVPTGDWTTFLCSTKVPAQRREEMLEKARRLLDAVKTARERANGTEIEKQRMGDALLRYVVGDTLPPANGRK